MIVKAIYLSGAFLQRAHNGNKHLLVGGLEEASKERNDSCLPHCLLVVPTVAATPQRQSSTACNIHVLLLLRCCHTCQWHTVK